MNEEYVLIKIAEQITSDSGESCAPPDYNACEDDDSCRGECGGIFAIKKDNGKITYLFVCTIIVL